MKTLFVTSEKDPRETRVALTPSDAQKLAKLGWEIHVESGAGAKAGFTDEDYAEAGAKIADAKFASEADFVAGVRKPSVEDVAKLNAAAHPRVVAKLLEAACGNDVAFAEVQVPEALAGIEHELWLVTAPAAVRAKRVAARDGRSEEEIAAMFALRNAQEPTADEVIDTDCSPRELRRKVDAALRRAKLI